MKKIVFILLATIALTPAFAQLKSTRWEGAIKGDNPQNVILDFKKDTFVVYTVPDNQVVETMTYSISGGTFTIKKIAGQSDCDSSAPGTYEFEIKGDEMLIKLSNDPCYDRSSAIDTTKWTKLKKPAK